MILIWVFSTSFLKKKKRKPVTKKRLRKGKFRNSDFRAAFVCDRRHEFNSRPANKTKPGL